MKDSQATHTSWKAGSFVPYMLGVISIAWLPYGLATPIAELFPYGFTSLRFILGITCSILFVGIYLWGIWGSVRYLANTRPPLTHAKASVWLTVAVLTALSIIMVETGGKDWGGLFIFTCSYASGRLPTVQAIWAVVGLLLLTLFGGLHHGFSWPELGAALFLISVVGIMVICMVRSFRTSQELHAAREEIARLAVTTERLRIARDLHDLLGHSLSLIALKSELAGRLIGTAPERAAIEIGDVEHVARTTLQQVREAVGSYRQPTLASELQGAEEILNAAGIAYRYEGDEGSMGTLPATIEAVFAWAVREGVTNVIRHSRAHQCTIHMTRTKHEGYMEIINDGAGIADQVQDEQAREGQAQGRVPTGEVGNGLRGLTERVEALGGRLEAGPDGSGSFRLAVSVPLVQKVERPDVVTIPSVQLTSDTLR